MSDMEHITEEQVESLTEKGWRIWLRFMMQENRDFDVFAPSAESFTIKNMDSYLRHIVFCDELKSIPSSLDQLWCIVLSFLNEKGRKEYAEKPVKDREISSEEEPMRRLVLINIPAPEAWVITEEQADIIYRLIEEEYLDNTWYIDELKLVSKTKYAKYKQ